MVLQSHRFTRSSFSSEVILNVVSSEKGYMSLLKRTFWFSLVANALYLVLKVVEVRIAEQEWRGLETYVLDVH